MAQVNVTVNGRTYTVACDDGEEAHLQDLARYLDKHVQDLAGSVGQVGDMRLLLLAGLLVADELSAMLAKVDELTAELEGLKRGRPVSDKAEKAEALAAQALETAARRIDDIARRITSA